MRAGRLNQRVIVKRPVRTRDAIGGAAITWQTAAQTWCSIWPIGGRESVVGGAMTGTVTHEVRLRKQAVPGLQSDYRFEMAGRTFEIISVLNVDERGDQWRCLVAEQTA